MAFDNGGAYIHNGPYSMLESTRDTIATWQTQPRIYCINHRCEQFGRLVPQPTCKVCGWTTYRLEAK